MGLITVNTENFQVASIKGPIGTEMRTLKPEEQITDPFNGELGCLPGETYLEVDNNIQASILPPRKLPHAIRPTVKAQLDKLVQQGVIVPIQ